MTSIACNNLKGVRIIKEVQMYKQLVLLAFLLKYWADNQVSCNVTFDPQLESPQIQHSIAYDEQWPVKTTYPYIPYEEITKKQYYQMIQTLSESDLIKKKSPSTYKTDLSHEAIQDDGSESVRWVVIYGCTYDYYHDDYHL